MNFSSFGATRVSAFSGHLTPPDPSTASLAFEFGPAVPPIGDGSGEWRVGADADSGQELRFEVLDGVLLADITRFGFWTREEAGSATAAVNLSMRVDWNNDGIEDDRIYFEPVYQHLSLGVPDQGALAMNTWQEWDALAGGWWSNNDPAFTPAAVGTLAAYIAAHPGTKVIHHTDGSGGTRLIAGYGAGAWDGFVGNADAFEVGILGDVITFDLDP